MTIYIYVIDVKHLLSLLYSQFHSLESQIVAFYRRDLFRFETMEDPRQKPAGILSLGQEEWMGPGPGGQLG